MAKKYDSIFSWYFLLNASGSLSELNLAVDVAVWAAGAMGNYWKGAGPGCYYLYSSSAERNWLTC